MDRLFQDLNGIAKLENSESIHLSEFPIFDASFVDKTLERKMENAQTIASLVLSLRAKEKIKVRQPLQKIMIPVDSEEERNEIFAVSELIKREVNVKEIELLTDASDILVKQIKPNFKVLGPKFGKDMRHIAAAVQQFTDKEINSIEKEGQISLEINEKLIILERSDVEITSKDIEGWLVANEGAITVALDVTITAELKEEGIARELVNRIQNARKDSGLEVTDKIRLTVGKFENLEAAVEANRRYVMNETLTEELVFVDELNTGTPIEFESIKSKLLIEKM